jgi:hypothetical protein
MVVPNTVQFNLAPPTHLLWAIFLLITGCSNCPTFGRSFGGFRTKESLHFYSPKKLPSHAFTSSCDQSFSVIRDYYLSTSLTCLWVGYAAVLARNRGVDFTFVPVVSYL